MEKLKIAFGSDHAGFNLKKKIIRIFTEKGYLASDEGTYSEESCDYPDFAKKVVLKVKDGIVDRGILICGTGIGMSIAANKIHGIRAALCYNEYTAEMSRKHNNANVLCLGARVLDDIEIIKIIDKWLSTEFEGERHQKRIEKMFELENI